MAKSKDFPVPEGNPQVNRPNRNGGGQQEPLSGSKKTKQHNHVSHNNPEGS
ncbi:small acid-soluble spore protein P [Paenibacillus sp. Soil522]|uniref:small acid-soluble spore protein P n=1 Tax=Paenibacillus sp. Soil522 TaxID=1736388 RepID=UPI0006F3422F|nr:small acid-soluble spore protein P [Paenibacillus sp. Soil522]KRE40119.1 spore protein [Paenibacillus sp. Soil522]